MACKISKSRKMVNDIINSFSAQDRELFGIGKDDQYLINEKCLVKRAVKRVRGRFPVSFCDILIEGDRFLSISVGTRLGYRGHGYASRNVKKIMDWVRKNAYWIPQKYIHWSVKRNNIASIKLAQANGFEVYEDEYWSAQNEWMLFTYEIRP